MVRNTYLAMAICSSFTLFAGCIVGPDFQRPSVPFDVRSFANTQEPPSVEHPEAVAAGGGRQDIHSWWRGLGDPLLVDLMVRACHNNPSVMEASARVAEARSIRESIVGTALPQIDTEIGFAHRRIAPASSGQEGRRSGDAFDSYTHNLRATWEIDLFGRIRRSVEASNARANVAEESYRDVLTSLMADVATNYVEMRVLQRRLAISRENAEVQTKNMKMARTRYKAGLVGLLDVKQAETGVQTTRAQIPGLEEQIRVRLHRLSTLIGQPPSQAFFAHLSEGSVPMPQIGIATGIPAQLVSQRPDVRLAEQDLHAATADIGVATAELYPQLTLLGSPSFDTAVFSQWYRSQSFGFNVGPTVRWNLFAFGRIMNTIEAQRAAADQAELRFRQAVLLAIEEVESGLVAYRKSQERAKVLSKAAEAAAEAVGLSESTYQIGRSTFQRVIDAQRQLLQSQDQLATARGDIVLSWIRTYRALGGGWGNSPCRTGQQPYTPAVRGVPQGYGPPMPTDGSTLSKDPEQDNRIGIKPKKKDADEDSEQDEDSEPYEPYEQDRQDEQTEPIDKPDGELSTAMVPYQTSSGSQSPWAREITDGAGQADNSSGVSNIVIGVPFPTDSIERDPERTKPKPNSVVPWGTTRNTPPAVIFTKPQPYVVPKTQPWNSRPKAAAKQAKPKVLGPTAQKPLRAPTRPNSLLPREVQTISSPGAKVWSKL